MPSSEPDPFKTPRGETLYLEVETDDCPQALLRVLNLLTLLDRRPLSLSAERHPDRQRILLGLEPFDAHRAEILVNKIRAIVSVMHAGYVQRDGG